MVTLDGALKHEDFNLRWLVVQTVGHAVLDRVDKAVKGYYSNVVAPFESGNQRTYDRLYREYTRVRIAMFVAALNGGFSE